MLSTEANINSPTQIRPNDVAKLAPLWSFATSGDISATPTVEPGGLYVPDWGGMLYKLNPITGAVIWSNAVKGYTKIYGSASRSSPAIGPSVIVFGDALAHDLGNTSTPGATVLAVNKATGALVWQTILDQSSQWSEILGSPVIYGNMVYVGTASTEEGHGKTASFVPSFRGSMTALDINTGAIVWQFTTVPQGYTGGAIPGNSPVVYTPGHSLIFGTGNNYTVPSATQSCVLAAGSNTTAQTACLDPTDYVDSLVSVDLTTGKLNWARRMSGADAWTFACQYGYPSCAPPPGTDHDFASAPNLAWVPNFVGIVDDRGGTSQNYLLGAGQKNGVYWAVNPNNGGVFWSTKIGTGGIEWGSAVDTDDRSLVYVALNNSAHSTNTLVGQNGVPVTSNAGAWAALNTTTGKIIWQIPAYGQDLVNTSVGASAPGSMTFSNRILFAGSSSGYFTAIDGATGLIRWTFNSGGTVISSPAIYNETVYWGTGYARSGVGKHMLYAFSIPPS